MKRYANSTARPARRRRGFTLIELMMVIAVIAVLIALLMPAINGARERFRIAEVRNEISQLEGAIADFKLKFGHEPPSQVRIYEQWSGGWENDSQARATIRKLWPKFNFKHAPRDYDGNGNMTDVIALKGDQCLVFFLGGGFANGGTDSAQFTGFSGNPTNPFQFSSASTTTRIGPFFDFDMGRVIDDNSLPYSAPLSKFPVYKDPYPAQQKPYLYATSYDGLGYNDSPTDSDVFTAASDDPTTPAGVADFRIYLTDSKTTGNPDPPAWKPNSFQIISPGPDGFYGKGGPYKPDGTIVLPARVRPGANDVVDAGRGPEKDNITNFASGKLDF
jgi:general secretion pathway protein G